MDFAFSSLSVLKEPRWWSHFKICDIPHVTYWPKVTSCNLESELKCFVELGVVFKERTLMPNTVKRLISFQRGLRPTDCSETR